IYCHLTHYNCPKEQKLIIRIILIVPAYSVYSFVSILLVVHARIAGSYIEPVHDVAEAFAIYCFLALCYQYLGGEGNIMSELRGKILGLVLLFYEIPGVTYFMELAVLPESRTLFCSCAFVKWYDLIYVSALVY
ncbi:unnamed protein product, partial [Protopolystoma xenopodis]